MLRLVRRISLFIKSKMLTLSSVLTHVRVTVRVVVLIAHCASSALLPTWTEKLFCVNIAVRLRVVIVGARRRHLEQRWVIIDACPLEAMTLLIPILQVVIELHYAHEVW